MKPGTLIFCPKCNGTNIELTEVPDRVSIDDLTDSPFDSIPTPSPTRHFHARCRECGYERNWVSNPGNSKNPNL